jgi:hypothetical protein
VRQQPEPARQGRQRGGLAWLAAGWPVAQAG